LAFDFERQRTIIAAQRGPLSAILIAVGLGASFGAGALVGRGGGHAAASIPTDQNTLQLAASRTAKLEETRQRLNLSFAHELLRPDPKEKLAPLPRNKSGAAREATLAPMTAPIPAAAEADVAAPAKAVDADTATPPEDDDDEKPSPKKSDRARMQQALAKVLGEPAKAEVATAAKVSFSLQVSSTPVKENAEALQKKLTQQGHKARVVEASLDGDKRVYRVRVSGFSSREEADRYKSKLPMPAFVVGD
jgi:cell division protein FtsN